MTETQEVIKLLQEVLSNQAKQTEQISQLNKKQEEDNVQGLKSKVSNIHNEIWGSDPNSSGGLKNDVKEIKSKHELDNVKGLRSDVEKLEKDVEELKTANKTLLLTLTNLVASENKRSGIMIAITTGIVLLGGLGTILTIYKMMQ